MLTTISSSQSRRWSSTGYQKSGYGFSIYRAFEHSMKSSMFSGVAASP